MTGPLIRCELLEGRLSLTVPSTGMKLTVQGWGVRYTMGDEGRHRLRKSVAGWGMGT